MGNEARPSAIPTIETKPSSELNADPHHDPVPDELCPHVELGAEMTGGWYFAVNEPPVAVGMCHECIVWCRVHFEPGMPWSTYAAMGGR